MYISIIGAGNVAQHLAISLEQAGHRILEIQSRSMESALSLSSKLTGSKACTTLNFRESKAEIFFICIPDQHLPTLAQQLQFPADACVFHTSGTLALSALPPSCGLHRAVFYPLQTFSKAKAIDFKKISIFIESESEHAIQLAKTIGNDLGSTTYLLSSSQRLQLHIAAVFACNFTNHMLHHAKKIMDQANLPYSTLFPLLQETIEKSQLFPPKTVQTGPAIRKDYSTIHKHLSELPYPSLTHQIYSLISQSIIEEGEKV